MWPNRPRPPSGNDVQLGRRAGSRMRVPEVAGSGRPRRGPRVTDPFPATRARARARGTAGVPSFPASAPGHRGPEHERCLLVRVSPPNAAGASSPQAPSSVPAAGVLLSDAVERAERLPPSDAVALARRARHGNRRPFVAARPKHRPPLRGIERGRDGERVSHGCPRTSRGRISSLSPRAQTPTDNSRRSTERSRKGCSVFLAPWRLSPFALGPGREETQRSPASWG